MALSKVRSIVSLIILVAIITFVLTSTNRKEALEISAFGGVKPIPSRVVILSCLAVGFVLGYVFRITRFFRKKVPKKMDQ